MNRQIIKTKYGKARINSTGYYMISTQKEGNFEKYGKQKFSVRYNGKGIKHSVNVSSLVDWFTKEYPTTILKISGVL